MATKCGADPYRSLSAEWMGEQGTGRRRWGALLSSKLDRPMTWTSTVGEGVECRDLGGRVDPRPQGPVVWGRRQKGVRPGSTGVLARPRRVRGCH